MIDHLSCRGRTMRARAPYHKAPGNRGCKVVRQATGPYRAVDEPVRLQQTDSNGGGGWNDWAQ
jgi:hypothetical protein